MGVIARTRGSHIGSLRTGREQHVADFPNIRSTLQSCSAPVILRETAEGNTCKMVRLSSSISHSTSAPLFSHNTLARPGLVSDVNKSAGSSISLSRCGLVVAPFIALVALVEIPPQNDDLSNKHHTATVFQHGVDCWHTRQTASDHDGLVGKGRHRGQSRRQMRSAIDHESSRTQLKLEVVGSAVLWCGVVLCVVCCRVLSVAVYCRY